MNWLESLNSRTKEEVSSENSAFRKAWCVFLPVIIYYLVDTITVKCGAMLIKNAVNVSPAFASFCENNSSAMSVIIKAIAMLCGICPLLPFFLKEKPVLVNKKEKGARYAVVILAGISTALFWNLLFAITGFTGSSAEYSEVSQKQFSLPLLVGILLYGILTPIIEEILFRGLVYNRLARNYNIIMALVCSAALFGFYHGNIVQAVYGLLMGALLAWVYERYGAFIFPVIIHGVANTWIYLCMNVDFLKRSVMNAFTLFVTGAIMMVCLIYIGRDTNDGQ